MAPRNKKQRINKAKRMEEIIKCGSDPTYFINNYVKIPHPKRGLIKFQTFPFQDDCLEAFQTRKKIIVNKSRQLGLSTVAAAYSLWMVLFQREKNILIIATRLETAKIFIDRVRTMLGALPDWLVLPEIKGDSVKHILFSNGSKIKASTTSKEAGRGEALSLLIVDEAAHIDNMRELWLGLQPTLSTGGSSILISSPSGVGTLFHEIWMEAQEEQNTKGEGRNGFYPIELPWTVHPEHDEKWFEEQKKQLIQALGERGVAQELLCSFMASGNTFINNIIMDRLYNEIVQPNEIIPYGKYEVWVWERPQSEHRYIICADVAAGKDDGDYSTFNIIDIETDSIAADFKGRVPGDEFGHMLVEFGRQYNNALICQELNAVGNTTATTLKNSSYTNLYYEKFMKNIYMTYHTQDIGNELPGLTTTVNSRVEMLMKMENSIRNRTIKLRSKRLFEELQTFVWKGNKPQAQKGYHDDLIMSLAIGCNIYEAAGRDQYSSDDLANAMMQAFSRESQQMNPTTGKVNNLIESKVPGRTSDGYWETPDTTSDLRSQAEKSKQFGLKQKNTHNYNDGEWRIFDWMWKD